MCTPRILTDFTEKVLAIDQLQRSSPQRAKMESQPHKLLLLNIRHHADDVRRRELPYALEAFVDSISGTWAGYGEFHFREIGQGAVIDVCNELVSKKIADHRIGSQDLKPLLH